VPAATSSAGFTFFAAPNPNLKWIWSENGVPLKSALFCQDSYDGSRSLAQSCSVLASVSTPGVPEGRPDRRHRASAFALLAPIFGGFIHDRRSQRRRAGQHDPSPPSP